LFGKKSFAKLLGIFVSINTAGYAVGVPVANLCFDMIGTYKPFLFALSIIMLAIMIVFRMVLRISGQARKQVENQASA
jgi:type IV secretory pathway VirB3-like protein